MEKVTFSYADSCRLEKQQFQMLIDEVKHAAEDAQKAYDRQYATPYAFAYVPHDEQYYQEITQVAERKRAQRPAALFVIGIGGSSMGTVAVEDAVRGLYSHTCTEDIAFYVVDTIDTARIHQLCTIAKQFLEAGEEILLNIVSKSGTTTEMQINASIFIDMLHRYRPDTYHDWIVITTDAGSPLEAYAQKRSMVHLRIPEHVVGRYSVLSAVGIFPLHVLGVDTRALRKGARQAIHTCLHASEDNPAINSAIILYQHYAHGRNIHDTFLFDAGLRHVGEWYRQLMGESIGKKKGHDAQSIRVGITPTVSIGTIDLHSVAQLYLAGPHDKFTTFVDVAHHRGDITIPDVGLTQKLPVTGKTIESVKEAILSGVKRAYQQEKRPYVSVSLASRDEEALGEFMQFKMFEIVYLAHILQVNPFDQPQVELYKEETRNVLQEQEKGQ